MISIFIRIHLLKKHDFIVDYSGLPFRARLVGIPPFYRLFSNFTTGLFISILLVETIIIEWGPPFLYQKISCDLLDY